MTVNVKENFMKLKRKFCNIKVTLVFNLNSYANIILYKYWKFLYLTILDFFLKKSSYVKNVTIKKKASGTYMQNEF